jgi:glycosyltransferase involved in cell wall biosynthesis
LKITYIYRKKNKNGQSIENVFNTIINQLEKYNTIDIIYYENNLFNFIVKILRSKSDIFHITGDINFLSIFTRIFNKKTITTIHDLGHYKNLTGIKKLTYFIFWIQLPILFSHIITSISKYTIDDITNISKFKKNKIKLVYNPLQSGFIYHPKELNYSKPVILIVGTEIHKNILATINALKGINCELHIIGKLSNIQIEQLKISGIQYKNKYNIDNAELLNFYINSDILSFQSKHEGFGLPIIEAQALGRLVLCSKCCSIPEIAANGAVYCNADDLNDLKEKFNFVLNIKNANFVNKIIENGLNNSKNYNAKIISENYYNLYNNVLNEKI